MALYRTRRGALLSKMEHRCIEPGKWLVEGIEITRLGNHWLVDLDEPPTAYPSFVEALEAVAEHWSQVEEDL